MLATSSKKLLNCPRLSESIENSSEGLIVAEIILKAKQKNFRWLHLVIYYKSRGFGELVREEQEISGFDAQGELETATGDVVAFTFCRRLVTNVLVDGILRETKSSLLTHDGGPKFLYLIDPRTVATRKELSRWWRTGRRDLAKFDAMEHSGTDHVASWKHGINLGFDPMNALFFNRRI